MAMRIRTIRPEMLDDEGLCTRSIGARLLGYGLIHLADDEGRFRAAPTFLKARVFAYNDDLDLGEVGSWLNELAGCGFVELYRADGQTYGWMPNWTKHQKIDRPRPSLLPDPSDCALIDSSNDRRTIVEASSNDRRTAPTAVPTYTDILAAPLVERDSRQFDERSTKARRSLVEPSSEEGKGLEGKGLEGRTAAVGDLGTPQQPLPSVVQQVMNVLDTCPKWTVDDINTRGQVENALAAGGVAVAVQAAHDTVAWGFGDCQMKDPGAAFRVVLRQHRDGTPKPRAAAGATREHPADRMIRELDDMPFGEAA